jgi:hypothetical protein
MLFEPTDKCLPLDDHQKIIRYMRVPAFLMLLKGKVFLPSLETLQRGDPWESQLPLSLDRHLHDCFDELFDRGCNDWLESLAQGWEKSALQVRLARVAEETGGGYGLATMSMDWRQTAGPALIRIWLRELAKRRCVWCWNNAPYQKSKDNSSSQHWESMGLWNVYGSHGVAIVSSPDRIRNAVQLPDGVHSSAGNVNYLPLNSPNPPAILREPIWLHRPYYFKLNSYEYEREVRFVIAVDHDRMRKRRTAGVVLDIKPEILLDKVVISPHLNQDEAECLEDIMRSGIGGVVGQDKNAVDTSLLLNFEKHKAGWRGLRGISKEFTATAGEHNPFLGKTTESGTFEAKLFASHAV